MGKLLRVQAHPHIVHIYGYATMSGKTIGILMEHCKGGSLHQGDFNNTVPSMKFSVIHNKEYVPNERKILSWSEQAASGIMFLHSENIIHLDIKPSKYDFI